MNRNIDNISEEREAQNKKLSVFSNPRFKHGSLATAITAVVLVLIILVNVAFTLLGNRVDMRFDITANHLFSLTDEAKAYFMSIDEDVTVTVLSSESALKEFSIFSDMGYDGAMLEYPLRRLPEILSDLEKNDHINVKYVDMDANPSYLNKYELISVPSVPEMYMLVESAKRYKLVDMTTFINTDLGETSSYSTEEFTYYYFTEQPLINAFGYVLRDSVTTAAIVNGHGELTEETAYADGIKRIFENNGLAVEAFDFTTEAIPESTKFLVVTAPSRDFSQDEIVKLDAFLQNGKDYGRNLLYFDGGAAELPNLYSYLELNWGIRIDPNSRVYDSDNCFLYAFCPLAVYDAESDICKELATENVKTVLKNPEPINVLWTERDIRTVTTLLSTNDTSFIRANDANMDAETAAAITRTDDDVTGTHALMTLTRKRNTNLPIEESSNVLVTSDGFIDFAIEQPTFGNDDLITSILESMQEASDPVTIVQKDLMTETITLSNNQIKVFALVFSIAFPVIIAAIGIFVFVKRKNL